MNMIKEEIHWSERTRQNWFQLGDKNNKNFQTMTAIRNQRSTIWKIKDEQRNCFEDQEGISHLITKRFSQEV